ncbi:cation transporter [Leptospira hartskeerlii]|uniref:Cation transporter n=1 Tax=Leptospira hartskeerlii TaxID=2023177 RepID=A0A2M9XEJ7_9LEPT|nr:cation-translocating P-type ATPase [Leptospira hartskeerlii]PJZ26107.1 cation transporter [Leptospira hartskeerlii]PJZ34191.1 cation transporter [Leptospira hartskeerlii]
MPPIAEILYKGLSSQEASELLQKFGPNESKLKKTSFWRISLSILEEPMLSLLLACGFIYALLGDLEEAITLSIAVIAVISLTIYQKNKSEKALESLRKLSPLKAKVIREGRKIEIDSALLVPGDLVFLSEGDKVPADGYLVDGLNLHSDESLLTGESIPVLKEETDLNNQGPYSDFQKVYSGTKIVSGEGIFKVLFTGDLTSIGSIGKEMGEISESESPLQKEAKRFTTFFFLGALVISFFLIYGLGIRNGNWMHAILAALTFLMAVLPEEIPVVLSIFFSLGAWRISKSGVLTRKLNSIESLGAATVLCVDKTGTLTENQMKVKGLVSSGENSLFEFKTPEVAEEFHLLLEFSILASKKDPFDPMEKAIRELGIKLLYDTEHLHADWTLEKEYPLSPKLLALSYAWNSEEPGTFVIGTKGAPEAIFDLCHFSKEKTEAWEKITESYSLQGYRAIGVARSRIVNSSLPENQHDLEFEFLGLVLLEDPIRETVPSSVSECIQAGIRVIIITGDHAGTAKAVASKIGLEDHKESITGDELEKLTEEELDSKLDSVGIFSRIKPAQKLKIVRAFQKKGEIVAMTGDGVNDALALQAAHIGISMGKRGTDVAREASDLVLLDDNFSSIVKSVFLGRRIYENIQKSISYIVSVHIPIIGMSLLPAFTGDPIFFFPAHILVLELIIDPTCSIVFESLDLEKGDRYSSPRRKNSSLMTIPRFLLSFAQGAIVLISLLALYFWMKEKGIRENEIRSFGFIFLVVSNFSLMLTNLTHKGGFVSILRSLHSSVFWIFFLAAAALIASFQFEFSLRLFGFHKIELAWVFYSIGLGLISGLVWEIRKIRFFA